MGDDTVIECVFGAEGEGAVYLSFNGGSYNVQLLDATPKVLRNSTAALKDGRMICSTEIVLDEIPKLEEADRKRVHALDSKRFILQYAKGLANTETGEKLIHSMDEGSELYPWSTTKKVRFCNDCPQQFAVITDMAQ